MSYTVFNANEFHTDCVESFLEGQQDNKRLGIPKSVAEKRASVGLLKMRLQTAGAKWEEETCRFLWEEEEEKLFYQF